MAQTALVTSFLPQLDPRRTTKDKVKVALMSLCPYTTWAVIVRSHTTEQLHLSAEPQHDDKANDLGQK